MGKVNLFHTRKKYPVLECKNEVPFMSSQTKIILN